MERETSAFSKKRENGLKKLVLPVLILLCIIVFTCIPLVQRLTVTKKGTPLFALPIQAGQCFEIRYLHSANRSPVTDTIEWTGEELMVRETLYKTFGAGIPIPADGIGTELVKTDEGYVLKNINKPMKSFLLMTQTIPDHHLAIGGASYRLIDYGGVGAMLDIRVQRVPLLYAWRYTKTADAG
ncbi:MAG: DUF1850 domain-containing protein [Eubacteriales bacterium]|nr:DUF1850 domain-containing protein [Eubacteriales bacterium]